MLANTFGAGLENSSRDLQRRAGLRPLRDRLGILGPVGRWAGGVAGLTTGCVLASLRLAWSRLLRDAVIEFLFRSGAEEFTNAVNKGEIMKFAVKVPGLCVAALALFANLLASAAEPPKAKDQTMAEVLAASKPGDWRVLDPENTMYMELGSGRVVIELAPAFAPRHVANVKALAREHYYDGLAIIRVQDNYVAQWGDPNAERPELARKIVHAQRTLAAEFERPLNPTLPFTRLPDGDVYAPEVGFSGGFPVARDKRTGKMWLVHGYGMVGAGRDNSPDSGGGTELYVVIGQAPRHLDRNVTLLGRVVQGMELLSALPRGPSPMGFYDKPEQRVPIKAIRIAADVPESERSVLEIMRTDTPAFQALIESRRNRREEWYQLQANRIEIGNVPIPVRARAH